MSELPQISLFSHGSYCSSFDLSESVQVATSGSLTQYNLYNTGVSNCAFGLAQDEGLASQLCTSSVTFCSDAVLPDTPLKKVFSIQETCPDIQASFNSDHMEYLRQLLTLPSLRGIFSEDITDSRMLDEMLSNKMSCFSLLQCCALEISKMRKQMDLMAPIESLHSSQSEIDFLQRKLDAANKQASAFELESENLKMEMISLKEKIGKIDYQSVPTAKVEGMFKTVVDIMQSLKENTDRDSSEKIERALIVLKRKMNITLGVNGLKSISILPRVSKNDLKTTKALHAQKVNSGMKPQCQEHTKAGNLEINIQKSTSRIPFAFMETSNR